MISLYLIGLFVTFVVVTIWCAIELGDDFDSGYISEGVWLKVALGSSLWFVTIPCALIAQAVSTVRKRWIK